MRRPPPFHSGSARLRSVILQRLRFVGGVVFLGVLADVTADVPLEVFLDIVLELLLEVVLSIEAHSLASLIRDPLP